MVSLTTEPVNISGFFAFKHSPRTSWTVIKMQYQRFVCQFYWFYLPVIKSHSTFLCWPILLIVPLFDIHIRSSNLHVFQIYSINAFMLFADCHSFGDQTNRHKRLTSQKPDLKSKAIAFYWIMNFIDVYIAFLQPINFVTAYFCKCWAWSHLCFIQRNNTFYDQLNG